MPKTSMLVTLSALLVFAAPAVAQTGASAPPAKSTASAPRSAVPTPTATPSAKQQRTAKSMDCSKQADGKNIHGKERRKFMSSCKRG